MSLLAAASSNPAGLHGVFGFLAPFLEHYGYLAVAVVLFLENMLLPFPGETVLIGAAVYAGTGRLSVVLVGLIALAAEVAGAATGYWIGVRTGRRLVDRYGRYVLLTPDRMDRVEEFFARRGRLVLTIGRFIEGVRQLMAVTAGISDMSFREFMLWTTLGGAFWTAVWVTLGYVAGNHVETVSKYSTYVFVGLAVLVAVGVWRHVRHSRQQRREQEAA